MISGAIGLLFLMFWQWIKSKTNFDNQKYFKEFFSSLKEDWKARSYNLVNYTRRFLLVALVILLRSTNLYFVVGTFVTIQLVYTVIITWLRPFESSKDNLIEIVNEIIFLLFSASLVRLNKSSHWGKALERVFMYLLVANTVIVTGILL